MTASMELDLGLHRELQCIVKCRRTLPLAIYLYMLTLPGYCLLLVLS